MASDVREIANAVLEVADAEKIKLTNLSLNKIVFFAHAWHLACYNEPLIDTPFEAWQYGPVHPQVHRQLKYLKSAPIRGRLTRIDPLTGNDVPVVPNLTKSQTEIIERVTRFYGRYSGSKLVNISHEPGAPWDRVWRAADKRSSPGMVIPDTVIQEFYGAKLAHRS